MQVPLGPFYSDPTEKIKFKIDGFFPQGSTVFEKIILPPKFKLLLYILETKRKKNRSLDTSRLILVIFMHCEPQGLFGNESSKMPKGTVGKSFLES